VNDHYRESAEYIDIMSRDAWRELGPLVTEALADPAAGPVVDLGAGSGLGTMVIAKALPHAEIIAVEPSSGLRAVLLSKVYDDPDLARRVTVLDTDAQHATLPERLGAVVAMNMIGHLDRGDRRALWTTLAKRLAPGAPIVLNLQPPGSAIVLPDTRFTEIAIGGRTYEGWGRAEPHGTDAVTWHMRYRVLDDGEPVSERAVDYRWWIVTEDDLRAETAEFGLTVRMVGPTAANLYAMTVENDNHKY
jgi:SAM-dependent methyltransferase